MNTIVSTKPLMCANLQPVVVSISRCCLLLPVVAEIKETNNKVE